MTYLTAINAGRNQPQLLEDLYQTAQQDNQVADFSAALGTCYQDNPGNVLYAAWHYRLQQEKEQRYKRKINWRLAVPLAIVMGLIFWVLSLNNLSLNFADGMPFLAQIWALIAGGFVITFMIFTAKKHYRRAAGTLIGWLLFGGYTLIFSTIPNDIHYQTLMIVHLPLLAWIGVGITLLGQKADHHNRFAFLIKSIEVFVVGGIYLIGGGIFAALTFSLFQTIEVRIPEPIEKVFFPGGVALIILLATASTYDPLVKPMAQNFRYGLSKLVSTLMRLLMPLTLLVLIIFSYFILQPENFWIPFNNRDALITYNAMLFAVVFLLVGAIPVYSDDLSSKIQSALRTGIIVIAILTVLVSLYAMSATLYRTYLGMITMNRMTVIGWNTINIGLLLLLTCNLLRSGRDNWVRGTHRTFGIGMVAYIGWTVFVILSVPFIFGPGLAGGWGKPPLVEISKATAMPAANETNEPAPRARTVPTPTPASLAELPAGCPPACISAALAGAYLYRAELRGADLTNANLRQADLRQADLSGASLGGADLSGARLQGVSLEAASLHLAKIDNETQLDSKWYVVWQIVNQGAPRRDFSELHLDLSQANLSGANLREANLAFVSLSEADLRGANLTGANLANASLQGTIIDESTSLDDKWRLVWDIVNKNVSRSDLSGLNLSQANLTNADLSGVNLSRAVLTDTNLTGASLYRADLSGAILTEPDPEGGPHHQTILHQTDLAGVVLDNTTRIEEKWRLVWEIVNQGGKNYDLSGADLTGADLHEVDLSGARLIGARLDEANLQNANLNQADLTGASLHHADLTGANLAGANLFEAQLTGAQLPTDLGGANFRKANLNGANLQRFNLSGLNLSRADLRGANLAEANLQESDLSEAHFEGAYLWHANLQGANMRGAYLNKAYLWGANLASVDLTGTEMQQTIMPDGTTHE